MNNRMMALALLVMNILSFVGLFICVVFGSFIFVFPLLLMGLGIFASYQLFKLEVSCD